MTKTARIWVLVASVLLIAIGSLHLSGIRYMTETVEASDVKGMIKEVFPALFVHPSLHLMVIGLVGLVSTGLRKLERQSVAIMGVLVTIDGLLAIYLGAWLPASLLIVTVAAYQIALRNWS